MCETAYAIREESHHIEKQWQKDQEVYINLNSIAEDWCLATVVGYDGKRVFFRFEEDYYRRIQENFLFFKWWESIHYEKGEEWSIIPQEGRNIKEI